MLTDAKVKNAKASESAALLFDAGGLYLRVAPSGVKSWRWRREEGGRDLVSTLGRYPAMSLAMDRAPWIGVAARSPFCSPAGFGRFDQAAATGGRLASGSSLNGAMVSSVM